MSVWVYLGFKRGSIYQEGSSLKRFASLIFFFQKNYLGEIMSALIAPSSDPTSYRILVRSYDEIQDRSVYALSKPFNIGGRFVSFQFYAHDENPMDVDFFPSPAPLKTSSATEGLQLSATILCKSNDSQPQNDQRGITPSTLDNVTDVQVEITLPPLEDSGIDNQWSALTRAIGALCNKIFRNLNLATSLFILKQGVVRSKRADCLLFREDPSLLMMPSDQKATE
jgi:hypothetical protein